MTIDSEEQLSKLRKIGRIVARTTAAMGRALEPGMTTKALDDFGRTMLETEAARSAKPPARRRRLARERPHPGGGALKTRRS